MARAIRPRYSRLRVLGLVTFAVFVFVLVSACSDVGPRAADPSSTSKLDEATATSEPIFSSNEEALAAATEAYAKYLAMGDLIAQEGGNRPERIEAVASGQALEIERKSYAQFREARAFIVGETTFDTVSLQRADSSNNGMDITFYVCDDVSDVDLINDFGVSLVSPKRIPRTPFEVVVSGRDGAFVVSSKLVWKGDNFC